MVFSAIIKGVSTSNAAGDEKRAAEAAANTQLKMFNIAQQNLSPYNQFGQANLGPLNNLLTGSPSQIENQLQSLPGYQFALTQGLKATQNSAAARGLGVSGAALKGAATYATGLADSTYGQQVNRLMNAAGLGENAAAMQGTNAIKTGDLVGNSQIQAGNAEGAGNIGIGNAFTNWLNQANGLGMYMMGGF